MPSSNRLRTPSYRLHKPSGQAVVTIEGRDFYLGKFGSPESRSECDRLIAEWLAAGRRLPAPGADLTVNEVMSAYLRHADTYYVKNGEPTSEAANVRLAIRAVRLLYGDTVARDFGPLKLKTLRQAAIDSGLCRNEVNRRVRLIVRAFKWAVSEELVPPSVHHGLKAVDGLRKGRSGVRETDPVQPVPDARVDAVRPFVSPPVWGMIELMRLAGMRPGEAAQMRTCDIDRSGELWVYTPQSHKTEHHARGRRIVLGPRAQAVLQPWLRADPTAWLFQPREAMAELSAARRANRRTKIQPSQRNRRTAAPKRTPGDRYTVRAIGHAIGAACARAFPHPVAAELARKDITPERRAELEAWQEANRGAIRAWRKAHQWHANQLRHNAGTRIRKEFGLDEARAVLGHASPSVTEVYAKLDEGKAAEVMGRIG